jgi:hypothetical protein
MRTNASLLMIALVVFVAAASANCSGTPRLDGAKIDIPLFIPATVDDEHTATTSDDLHNIDKFATHTWDLSTASGWEAVDAFYREKLPGATRDDEDSPVPDDEAALENEVRYMWTPDGWTGGAKVVVMIQKQPRDGKTFFQISQDVLKH